MTPREINGWLRHIDDHDGDRRTHLLLATLIQCVARIAGGNVELHQVAPWLESPADRTARETAAERSRQDAHQAIQQDIMAKRHRKWQDEAGG